MDARRFDALARTLVSTGSRRGLLGLLTGLPLAAGLVAFLGDGAEAKGQRKRRKKPHHHRKHTGNRAGKKKKRRCKPNSKATTCAGKCGQVKNNCRKTVDCGSCACDPPCEVCFLCNDVTGDCEPDPAQQGDACGEPGQRCQSDGSCSCDATSCDPCETCQGDGACSDPCGGGGCCASGVCELGTSDTACGTGGADCVACPGSDTCGGGDPGTPGVCGCTPIGACPGGLDCGTIDDGCGSTISCGDCTPPETCGGGDPGASNVCGCTPTTCAAEGKNCGTIDDDCGGTLNCGGPCSNPTPICVSNVCTACSVGNPCPSGCCAPNGSCQPGTGDSACGTSGICLDCGFGRRCVSGQCVCDSTSCADGCCDGNGKCQVENNLACGTGGGTCSVSCADDRVCSSGACVTCASVCTGCSFCIRDIDGSWRCGTTPAGFDCAHSPCTATSQCLLRTCAVNRILVSNGSAEYTGPLCSLPAGTGVCLNATACTGT